MEVGFNACCVTLFGYFSARFFFWGVLYSILIPIARGCDKYAQEFSIKFNAKKSKIKWLAKFRKKRRWLSSRLDHCRFQVNGSYVDTVNSFVHHRHTVNALLRKTTMFTWVIHVQCVLKMAPFYYPPA